MEISQCSMGRCLYSNALCGMFSSSLVCTINTFNWHFYQPFSELRTLRNHVTEGITIGGPVDRSSILKITRAEYDETPQHNVLSYRIKLQTSGLVTAAEAGIREGRSIKSMPGSTVLARPKLIQVPASILKYALPELVANFHAPSAAAKKC